MPVGLPRRPKRRPPPTAGRQRAQAKGVTRVSTLPQSAHRTGCRPRCRSRVTAATTQRAVSRAPVVPPGGAVAYKGGQPRLNRTRLHRGASPFHQPGRPLDVGTRLMVLSGSFPLGTGGVRRALPSVAMLGRHACPWEPVGWAFAVCAQRALAAPAAAPPPCITRSKRLRPRSVSGPPPFCFTTRRATSSPQANPSAACFPNLGWGPCFVSALSNPATTLTAQRLP